MGYMHPAQAQVALNMAKAVQGGNMPLWALSGKMQDSIRQIGGDRMLDQKARENVEQGSMRDTYLASQAMFDQPTMAETTAREIAISNEVNVKISLDQQESANNQADLSEQNIKKLDEAIKQKINGLEIAQKIAEYIKWGGQR
jgi:hypothetical protein